MTKEEKKIEEQEQYKMMAIAFVIIIILTALGIGFEPSDPCDGGYLDLPTECSN